MKKKKVFVTLFPLTHNIQLVKDVGMIPYWMHKNHYYDAYVACYDNDKYDYLLSDVIGLKIKFIDKKFKWTFLNELLFLVKFDKIDVLQLYHYSLQRLLLCFLFKLMTFGRGKTYIKLDVNEKVFESNYTGIKKVLNKVLGRFVDIISAETQSITDRLNTENILDHKIEFIPNGFVKNNTESISKKNKIITVGRIGDENKNNKLLLEAVKNIDLKNWTVEFIGPIEKDFESVISKFYKDNVGLKNNVLFTGNISNREVLNKKYAEARVFVLTSRSEGFPLVFLEAISNGCFLVSTNLIAAKEVSNNQKYGRLFQSDNLKELSDILANIIENENSLPQPQDIIKFALNNYYWQKIVHKINNLLMQ